MLAAVSKALIAASCLRGSLSPWPAPFRRLTQDSDLGVLGIGGSASVLIIPGCWVGVDNATADPAPPADATARIQSAPARRPSARPVRQAVSICRAAAQPVRR